MCQRMLSLRGDIDQTTTGRIIDEIIAINMIISKVLWILMI